LNELNLRNLQDLKNYVVGAAQNNLIDVKIIDCNIFAVPD